MPSIKKNKIKSFLKSIYRVFTTLFFDLHLILNKWRGLPYFFKTIHEYNKKNKNNTTFKLTYSALYPMLHERFDDAGSAKGHYFFQDLWASEYVQNHEINKIIDVGSRIDGYIAHLLPTTEVTYVDIRPINKFHKNFISKQGSILKMPFETNSVVNLSCLHVIEHIGLGRYGDKVNPQGYIEAIEELKRVCSSGGRMIIGVPVGNEQVYFNAHRVFDPQTIINLFSPFQLEEFSLIDDSGSGVIKNASIEEASKCKYGCGLFIFINNA